MAHYAYINRPTPTEPTMTTYLYEVTVTPSIVAHAGSWRGDSYTTTTYATSSADAIKRIRAARRAEDGSQTIPARYTARRADPAGYAE